MRLTRKARIHRILVPSILCIGLISMALGRKKDAPATGRAPMDESKRAVHALNRLTFGPRPGDIERVQAMGVDKWIDLQLHPDKIDDESLAARLQPFRTLNMSSREIAENFPPEQLIKQVSNGKFSIPRDPVLRDVYDVQLERYQEKLSKKEKLGKVDQQDQQAAAAKDPQMAPPATNAGVDTASTAAVMENKEPDREDRLAAEASAYEITQLPPEQRMAAIFKLTPAEQLKLAKSLRGDKREKLLDGLSARDRETFISLNNPQQVVNEELAEGKILRATYSERQLQEVMTDFWFNHFNVFIGKGADRYMLNSYERDVIRTHSMGKFEDLLVATAESPAMLFYLDNWLSVGPNSDFANGIKRNPRQNWKRLARQNGPVKQAKGKRNGLNENYGREVMELHTLGVNGGYTQQDVTELARIFTGWSLKEPREGGDFFFDERKHEPGEKHFLGHRIKPDGQKEGREALHILAHHPSTAKFVCTKLATRFVSDDPSPALVAAMSETFLKKDGDIREVLKTMLRSPDFWAADNYRAKVKTPLEFAVSALRASGAEVNDAMPIVRQLQTLGMPLYGAQPPTGYSMKASAWVNSSALLSRMNFALALTAGRYKGIQVDAMRALGTNSAPADSTPSDPNQMLPALENSLLAGDVSKQTHDTIVTQMQAPAAVQTASMQKRKPDDSSGVGTLAGLILGSPEFQRR